MPKFPVVRTRIESFGPFRRADIELSPSLNVIVGDNGTGKTQLMKLQYSCTSSLAHSRRPTGPPTKSSLGSALANKLVGVFRPSQLGRLTNRSVGRARSRIVVKYAGLGEPLDFAFSTNSKSDVTVSTFPSTPLGDLPVFLPAHELLSLYPGLVALYDSRELAIDETWRDTAELLARPPLRGPRHKLVQALLEPLNRVMEGAVVEDRGRFFLKQARVGNLEAPLVAEGQRKLAMLVRLVTSGVLLEGGYLYWDEPEANLNPMSQRLVAEVIVLLAKQGAQVTIATHSIYLLRELQLILAETESIQPRFIGLTRDADGVAAQSVDDLDDLDVIASLEAELEQSHRYLRA